MQQTQTYEVAIIMLIGTVFALASSELGFFLSGEREASPEERETNRPPLEIKRYQMVLAFAGAVVAAVVINYCYRRLIGFPEQIRMVRPFPINNLNSIINISLYYVLLSSLSLKGKLPKILLFLAVCFSLFYTEFLKGIRMDMINGILGMYVVYKVYKKDEITFGFKPALLLMIGFGISQWLGMIEHQPLEKMFDLEFISEHFSYLVSAKRSSNILFYQGTLNDISTTFSGIIYLIMGGQVKFLKGLSYFQFILRTPPQFLFPGRPEDLAWIFPKYGLTSGGGFFELAEAFYNFGFWGCLVIPGLISFLIGKSFFRALHKQRMWDYFVLFGFLSVWLRGLLYQSFSFWKAFVTAAILYAIYEGSAKIIGKFKKPA